MLRLGVAALLLMASCGPALAASYLIQVVGLGMYAVPDLSCQTVGDRVAGVFNAMKYDPTIGGNQTTSPFSALHDCAGSLHAVGDSMTLNLTEHRGSDFGGAAYSKVINVISIIEDDGSDDIAGVPLQRVALLVGCALMAGLGMLMGSR